ncbi:hypothetical protein CYL21_2326 [Plasmodium falciparum NF54]|uniref:Lipoprotein n=2 Tax=Plasmodium falciparum TaxID=5833 RepID=Q8IM76_PLAF7|nr:Plasmodium exported protein, unknown function [Plasmodium falciparum 3D7]EWC86113.1 hypothetical protein PFNF54_04844 [Plasmodium falciparum NF54]KAF4329162.1 hypothetical protein CYL21_2326 [Plasmodium falciparum NF54]PKC49612.1 hypothetical protein CK202_0327 [Plasmodium falciparum NF54]CZT99718.1 Plasmodium exported protein, unknown function [Plasmodium falciparum 3D7]|eukprot:XP_001348187.1 Plasmodium exported protein, unknown function [Plasmodium falciparum 3D7]
MFPSYIRKFSFTLLLCIIALSCNNNTDIYYLTKYKNFPIVKSPHIRSLAESYKQYKINSKYDELRTLGASSPQKRKPSKYDDIRCYDQPKQKQKKPSKYDDVRGFGEPAQKKKKTSKYDDLRRFGVPTQKKKMPSKYDYLRTLKEQNVNNKWKPTTNDDLKLLSDNYEKEKTEKYKLLKFIKKKDKENSERQKHGLPPDMSFKGLSSKKETEEYVSSDVGYTIKKGILKALKFTWRSISFFIKLIFFGLISLLFWTCRCISCLF